MPASEGSPRASRILVVDDNPIFRKKFTRAIGNLGHHVSAVEGGDAALSALELTPFDAVFLDIVMPEVTGFDVLEAMKRHPILRDIPVIVVSALERETDSVVLAIELGAEDFLPKDFDPVILKARLSACLSKKRHRDQEKEYYGQIEKLARAAEKIESGLFNPNKLDLEPIASAETPMGRLASVFQGMAGEIYQRESKAQRTISLLKASLWMLAMSAVYGLTPSLGRMASTLDATPLGLVVWTLSAGAVLLLSFAAYHGQLPRLRRREVVFFIVWALVSGVVLRVALFVASAHIQAAMVSLLITMQGFMVFAFASALKMERATPNRVLGLIVGLVGVSLALSDKLRGSGAGQVVWYAVAMLVPLCLAADALLMAKFKPRHIEPVAALGLMMLVTVVIIAPFAYARGELVPLSWRLGQLEIVVAALVFTLVASYLMSFHIIKIAGVVFYGQAAYLTTIAGVLWGMLLLDEALSPAVWLAFAVIFFGMYLVSPKPSDEELIIRRDFKRVDKRPPTSL